MKTRHIAIFGSLLLIVWSMTGCATTTFYRDGKPVASFQGDIGSLRFRCLRDGSFEWSAEKVSHSAATKAAGEAADKRWTAVGAAAAGLTLLKP